jgi:hypothetical protein
LLKRFQEWFTTNNNKKKIAMKIKNILACAVGAGLLTIAGGSARAGTVIEGSLVIPFDASLIIKYVDGSGKVRKATLNQKAFVAAISEDFDENFSGDQIVYYMGDDDFFLMDKNKVLEENLSEDGVIFIDHTEDSEDTVDGSNGSFHHKETGTADVGFFSDGEEDSVDSTLSFEDDSAAYTYTISGGPIKNDEQTITVTEKDGIDAIGHDFDVIDDEDLPIFGSNSESTSGKIIPL